MGRWTGILVVALVVALIGCGDSSETTASNPPVGSFVSTKDWSGDGLAFAKPVPVTIGNASVDWSSACNEYGAKPVRITPDLLDFSDASITNGLVGCLKPEDEQQQEDLETFFRSNPEWSLDGNRLTLSNDSVEVVLRVQGVTETTPYVELRGAVPGGLLNLLGSDADVATGFGCTSEISPETDTATSIAATKCTIKFGDVKRQFVRTSGGEWDEVEP